MQGIRLTYPALFFLCVLSARVDAQQEQPATARERQASMQQQQPNVQERTAPLRLTLRGTKRLDVDAAIDAVVGRGITRSAPSREGTLRAALLEVAAEQGHAFARIDSVEWRWAADSSAIDAVIVMTEGPLLRTGSITIDGAAAVPAEVLLRDLETQPEVVFRDDALTRDLRRIVAALDAEGHPFAEVQVRDLSIREQTNRDGDLKVDVALSISEGPLFFVDEITVEGNELTDTDVIVRETRIGEHERYDPVKVGDIRRRLERLRFFSRVDEPLLYRRDSTGGLLLRVAEGNTNQFDGVVGYQPPRGEEDAGTVTGLVNLSLRNLFGTGRGLGARWERATTDISELEIHYLEPWVAGLPLNLSAGLFQRQQDSAYVRRSVDGALTFLWSSDLQVTGSVQQTVVIPAEGAGSLARSSTLAGGIEMRIDTRDNVDNPRSGILLRNGYTGGSKRSSLAAGDVRSAIQRLELDAAYFLELLPRTVMAVALHGRELRGSDLDASDLYRLGGANSLRGYREEQFSGTRLGWSSLELRYSLGRRTFAFAFFDFGYIEQSPDPARNRPEFSALRSGYGIGGRLETGLGIIGVSYALGEGDGPGEGKIHFGLINAF